MDYNAAFQKFAKGETPESMNRDVLLAIAQKLDRVIHLMELKSLGPQQSFGGPIDNVSFLELMGQAMGEQTQDKKKPTLRPQPTLEETPIVDPDEKMTMRDSAGNPQIIRYQLPFGHGTVIYSRWPGDPQPWGFNLSVQGPDGIPVKYERVPTT